MVLEASILLVDNSEWMRNGDYTPSRFQTQVDAVNLLAGAKTQSNPENCVGVLSLAGNVPKMLVTPTPELGKILNCLQVVQIDGSIHFGTGVQVAQLALKHRQDKNQRQRIVVFVGSPITEDEETLVKIGKKLKKNNVAVDVVSFGDTTVNQALLEAFVASVNNSDNSHLVVVPPGVGELTDVLISSPVFGDGEAGSGFAAAAAASAAAAARLIGGDGFDYGDVDPNVDPELALALRVSMEEERARQEAATRKAAEESAAGAGAASTSAAGTAAPTAAAAAPVDDPMDDDTLLQQALAMSMGGAGAAAAPAAPAVPAAGSLEDLDPELALAMQMSMAEAAESAAKASGTGAAPTATAAVTDPAFLNDVLATLPGVDPNDPAIAAMLGQLGNGQKKEDKGPEGGAK